MSRHCVQAVDVDGVMNVSEEIKVMKHAALGFRAHSGWAAMVALSLENGEPRVLLRERPKLVETFTYEFRQPYHTAQKMPLKQADEFIQRSESEARSLASVAFARAVAEIQRQGLKITSCGLLLASARPLPELEKILASHALIHSADGELFRGALAHVIRQHKLRLLAIRERELLERGIESLGAKKEKLLSRLTALGKGMGPPWSQDEKFATLVAWIALISSAK